jgi:hypothetical protein
MSRLTQRAAAVAAWLVRPKAALVSVWTAGARVIGGLVIGSTLVVHSGALLLGGWLILCGSWAAEMIDARRHPELVERLEKDAQAG